MILPNADKAFVDSRKLVEYCLNSDHPRGKHKARVFQSALGLHFSDVGELRAKILEAVMCNDCFFGVSDAFGERFFVDFEWSRIGKATTVRSAWMIRAGEENPRLTSCFVLTK